MTKAAFALQQHNPDVLSCIANLSNDEVITPPEFANRMLDELAAAWADAHGGASIWADPDVTFLDPFTKSGVFLREITRRLTAGLKPQISDLRERVDHILTKQVFGIGITQLTALLARRSLYCSKYANGPHSIAKSFSTKAGNIWFDRTEHEWSRATEFVETADEQGEPVTRGVNGKCRYCGASQLEFERDASLETHAYAFIHADNTNAHLAELFGVDMQFDVVIGNPPYQINSEGNSRTKPIYNLFVESAFSIDPRFVVMVTPSRWFTGGLGLDAFRDRMLNDRRLRRIVDNPKLFDVFPSVEIKGGVSYFLWDRDHEGDCNFSVSVGGEIQSTALRDLRNGNGVLIRSNDAAEIIEKVQARNDLSVSTVISSQKPFGLLSNFADFKDAPAPEMVRLYKRGLADAWVQRGQIKMGKELIAPIKVLTPEAADGHGRIPAAVTGNPFVAEANSVCTQTFLVAGTWKNKVEARNFAEYLRTKFVRFLVHQRKVSQHSTSDAYLFVPLLDMSRTWTDQDLFARYGLTEDEASHIEDSIRPIDESTGDDE